MAAASSRLPLQCRGIALLNPQLADRTSVVRTKGFLSAEDIALVHQAAVQHKKEYGVETVDTPGKYYLQSGGCCRELAALVNRIAELVVAVDREHWGVLDDDELRDDGPLLARCVEYHEYHDAGRQICGTHHDAGSLFTADLMLSHTAVFEGGELLTAEPDMDAAGAVTQLAHVFERGDCCIFLSHKAHSVAKLRAGKRTVMVIEFWQECACCCNHRCMGMPPCAAAAAPISNSANVDVVTH